MMTNYLENLEKNLLSFDKHINSLTISYNPHHVCSVYGEPLDRYIDFSSRATNKNKPISFVSSKEREQCYELNQLITITINDNSLHLAASNLVALLSFFNPPTEELSHLKLLEEVLMSCFDAQDGTYEIRYKIDNLNHNEPSWKFQAGGECSMEIRKRVPAQKTLNELMLTVLPQWQTVIEKDKLEQSITSNLNAKSKIKI